MNLADVRPLLSKKESEVVDSILAGERAGVLAERLGLTPDAIEVRTRRIAQKAGLPLCPGPGGIREAVLRMRIVELENGVP